MQTSNEFYIGWQAEAPDGISKRVRQFVLALLLLAPVLGASVVAFQQNFATSTFEYGQVSELEGVLTMEPAPFLQVFRGKNQEGKAVFQNILLVAPGKHGATEMLRSTEQQFGHKLEGKTLKIKGFLIYHDGKTLLEVEQMEDVAEAAGMSQVEPSAPVLLGSGALTGEITDPKCLFGVMKPGYGKPHRSCAARCIAGGIPPVLKTVSATGQTQYFLLAGENGEPINPEILPFVGDQVQVCGEIYRAGDWMVLFKDAGKKPVVVASSEAGKIPFCK